MLEREKERQNLIITVDRQFEIFKNVVKLMLELDFTSESKEFFKEIIKDQNTKLLEYTRTLYSGINKPTLENLVDSLATHALLDRKGRDENQIGFINDFVLGTFIGEIIIETSIEKIQETYSAYMMELAVIAYKVQNNKNKDLLWEKIKLVSSKFQPFLLFHFELILKGELTKDYENITISDLNIFDLKLFDHNIGASLFLNSTFKNCSFDINRLNGVSFVNCTFIHCKVLDSFYLDHSEKTTVIKCRQLECSVLEFPDTIYDQNIEQFTSSEKQLLVVLLEFSKEKSVSLTRFLSYLTKSNKELVKLIGPLEKKGIVVLNDSQIYYNINKLPEIKKALNV
jgi:biotin operon repressor